MMRPEKRNDMIMPLLIDTIKNANQNVTSIMHVGNTKILTYNPNMTKEEHVTHLIGIPANEIPPNSVVGTDVLWNASNLIHEFEHLGSQISKGNRDPDPYKRQIDEIDADNAMNTLIKPYDDVGFEEYHKNARMIGAVYISTIELDPAKGHLHDILSHDTARALDNADDVN